MKPPTFHRVSLKPKQLTIEYREVSASVKSLFGATLFKLYKEIEENKEKKFSFVLS